MLCDDAERIIRRCTPKTDYLGRLLLGVVRHEASYCKGIGGVDRGGFQRFFPRTENGWVSSTREGASIWSKGWAPSQRRGSSILPHRPPGVRTPRLVVDVRHVVRLTSHHAPSLSCARISKGVSKLLGLWTLIPVQPPDSPRDFEARGCGTGGNSPGFPARPVLATSSGASRGAQRF